jgi:hypothetical protein
MPNPRFVARVKTENLRAEIWINRIPLAMLLPGDADGGVGLPLNEFIVSGTNRIGVVFHAGPVASRASEPWRDRSEAAEYHGAASLTLRLAQYADDQPVHRDDPPAILTIDWQGTAEPIPLLIEREFGVASSLGRWRWQDAEPNSTLADPLRSQAFEYLSRLHSLLAAGQFAAFIDESALKIEEYSRAYGIPQESTRRSMLRALSLRSRELQLLPFDPPIIDMRLVAEGRMIECLRTNRHHALEFVGQSDGSTFFLPAMIGVTRQGWRLLR